MSSVAEVGGNAEDAQSLLSLDGCKTTGAAESRSRVYPRRGPETECTVSAKTSGLCIKLVLRGLLVAGVQSG